MNRIILLTTVLLSTLASATGATAYRPPQYAEIQQRLASGWNTWNTRSVASHVLLPEGFAVNLAFKQHYWLDENYLREPLIGRSGVGVEHVRPGLHAYDGSYTDLELQWEEAHVRIESATESGDLVILLTPLTKPASQVKLIVESGMLWNFPGALQRVEEALRADLPTRSISIYATAEHVDDPYVQTLTPYLCLVLDRPIGISTGKPRSLEAIRQVIGMRKTRLEDGAAQKYGELSLASLAIQSAIAWNTIYEPQLDRVVSTVGRLWNEERGGYCLFGWDNFIPTIARNDPAFERQRYWKGAIWPPTNFLTYLSLRQAGFTDAHQALSEKSLSLLLKEWKRMGYVSENYSAVTGTGDDPKLSSDRYHSWGALMGIMAFIEKGILPAPEEPLRD